MRDGAHDPLIDGGGQCRVGADCIADIMDADLEFAQGQSEAIRAPTSQKITLPVGEAGRIDTVTLVEVDGASLELQSSTHYIHDDAVVYTVTCADATPDENHWMSIAETFGILPEVTLREARAPHSATLLDDGTVLIVGGTSSAGPLLTAELFDPLTERSRAVASLEHPRTEHSATKLD